jgi:hypothetical protein
MPALAAGIISTSSGPAPTFPATWDFIEVVKGTGNPGAVGAWQTRASSGLARSEVSFVNSDGRFFLTGGGTAHQAYDPATNTWTQAAPMPRPIGHITANVFVRNGRIVVVSGLTTNSVKLQNVIEYDPATDTWSELTPLPTGRQSPVSGLIGDQIVATCGLSEFNGNVLQNQTWVTTSTP